MHVAMSVGIDLRLRSFAPDKRIVRWRTPIVSKSQHLSDVGVEILGEDARAVVISKDQAVTIADRQIHHAIRPERRSSGRSSSAPRVGHENLFDVGQRRAVEARACQRDRRLLCSVPFEYDR